MLLRGTIVNSITPMNSANKIDVIGIQNHIKFLLSKGVGGFWFLGSAGEDFSIGFEERIVAAKTAAAECQKVPIIVGLGTMSFHEIQEFVNEIEKYECDFHILPYDQKLTGMAKLNYLEKIADIPKHSKIWLYHNPKRGTGISVKEAQILSDHQNIRGIKAGGYDLEHLKGMLRLHDDTKFQVYGAGGLQALKLYELGAQAHMTSDANIWPQLHNQLYKDFIVGDIKAAQRTQKVIKDISENMPKTENGENCVVEKFILSELGICKKYVNPSYQLLSKSDEERILQWMKSTSLFQ